MTFHEEPRFRSWRRRFWWLDVVYPLLFSVMLFLFVTSLFFSGPKHRRISSFWENKFLLYSIQKFSLQSSDHKTPLTLVRYLESDHKILPHAPKLRDAHITTYARSLLKLSELGVKTVVVNWSPAAHDERHGYYQPLIDAIREIRHQTKVIIAYPDLKAWNLPQELKSIATVVDDLTCSEPREIVCPYLPEAKDWVIEQIMQHSLSVTGKKLPKLSISENLTLPAPSYIVHTVDEGLLKQMSMTNLFDMSSQDKSLEHHLVILGNDLVQEATSEDQVDIIRRVWTAHDDMTAALRVQGTTLHVFWAQLADQFLKNRFVRVLPQWATWMIAASLSLFVVATILRLGAVYALAAYLFIMFSSPLANSLLIALMGIYVPLFDILYSGGVSFLLFAFFNLSLTTFQRWRLDARMRAHGRTTQLKNNFISLLSHNLNTPIAKMQGLFEVVERQTVAGGSTQDLDQAFAIVSRMRLTVRTVLVTASVLEGHLRTEQHQLNSFLDDFMADYGSWLRRLGLSITSKHQDNADGHICFFTADSRAAMSGLLAIQALFSAGQQRGNLMMRLQVDQERKRCHLTWSSDISPPWPTAIKKSLSERHAHELAAKDAVHHREVFDHTLLHLLLALMDRYGWHIDLIDTEGGRQLGLSLPVDL